MSRPIVDYKGRRRSKTIAFRVSPEEDEVINALVAASGMTKQDYITSRLECRDINVSPNVRVYRMLRDQMKSVYVDCLSSSGGSGAPTASTSASSSSCRC